MVRWQALERGWSERSHGDDVKCTMLERLMNAFITTAALFLSLTSPPKFSLK